MKIKELELLQHVIAFGSVSDAARAAFMTQPNASKTLKRIEERLGFQLFERINGRLHATAEGRLIAEQAEATMLSLRRFEERAQSIRDMRLGSLTLGAMPLLSRRWLPELLARFMRDFPEVTVNFQTRSSKQLIELVAERQLDLALGMLAIDDPLVDCRKLFDVDMVVALHHTHPLCRKRKLAPADLHEQDFIALSRIDRAREQVESYFQKHDVVPKERGECSLPGVALQLVEHAIAMTLVDRITASEYEGDQVVFRALVPSVHLSVWIMRPRMRASSRPVQEFERLIDHHAKLEKPAGKG